MAEPAEEAYNHNNLLSLFGYGRAAHERSGGICQLCGCGAGDRIDFDLWRQLTIEHLIGQGQGGYPPQIRAALTLRSPGLGQLVVRALADRIHEANIVTACQFCNSTTSRDRAPRPMAQLIAEAPDDDQEMFIYIRGHLQTILEIKRKSVLRKIQSIRLAFDRQIEPALLDSRRRLLSGTLAAAPADLDQTAP